MMTYERKEYIKKRLVKLEKKLDIAMMTISDPFNPGPLEGPRKVRNSCRQAINRWNKILKEEVL